MNSVYPIATTGDKNIGLLPESLNSFLYKYNAHQHVHINANNFLATGIKVGDIVNSAYFVKDLAENTYLLFEEENTVLEINEQYIRVTERAQLKVDDFLLYVDQKDEEFYISKCSVEANSDIIYINPVVGFVDSNQLAPLTIETYPLFFSNISNGLNYPVIISATKKFYLHSLNSELMIGNTGTVAFEILDSTNKLIYKSENFSLTRKVISTSTQTNTIQSFVDLGQKLVLKFAGVQESAKVALNVNIIAITQTKSTHYQT